MGRARRSKPKYELVTARRPERDHGAYGCRLHGGRAQGKVVSLWKRNGRHWGYACEECFIIAAPDYLYKGNGLEYAMRIDVSFGRDLKNKRLKDLNLAPDCYGIPRPI